MKKANPLNITRIDHVVIRVRDLQNMIDFYQQTLGCRLERGPGHIGLAQLRAGQSLIDLVDANGPLGRKGGANPDHTAPNMDHVCLAVEPWDQQAIEQHLRENDVEFTPVAMRYGASGTGPSLYLRDPEGNTVEIKGSKP